MTAIYIGLAAFAGSMLSGLLGWANSGESFVPRKWIGNLCRALIAGVGAAMVAETGMVLSAAVLGGAFMAGRGADNGMQSVSRLGTGMSNTPAPPAAPQPSAPYHT